MSEAKECMRNKRYDEAEENCVKAKNLIEKWNMDGQIYG